MHNMHVGLLILTGLDAVNAFFSRGKEGVCFQGCPDAPGPDMHDMHQRLLINPES